MRACAAVAAALLLVALCPGAALAQDDQPTAAETRSTFAGGRLLIGGVGAAGAVQHVGGVAGGELGFQLWDRLGIFGEALWMQDVVTRRRVDIARTVTTYLQDSQGKAASGEVTAPATYGGGGIRLTLLQRGRLRPYVLFSAGAAHVALRPAFALNGADITGALPQFGVTIGRDLSNEVTKPAFGGGGGVRLLRSRWYLDGSARVTSIRTAGQATNVLHVGGAFGLRF